MCFVPKGQTTVPLCDVCPTPGAGGWLNCEACHACLRNHSAARYNLQEGTCINEAQYGLLAGFGFSLLFVVAGLFAGRLADIANRRNVIALSLLAWSAATAGMGLAHNFGGLLSARVAQGVGQAFAAPASYSLIADYFPSEYRATANGLYAFGVYVGGGLSSLSLLLATWMGWRLTVMLVGGLGVLLSACVLAAVREPARAAAGAPAAASVSASASAQQEEEEGGGGGGRDALLPKLGEAPRGGAAAAPAPVSLGQAIRTVAQSREVMLLFVAAALRFVGGYSIAAFLPIYFKRQFPGQNKQYSLFNAGVVSVGGALSAYAGGWLADRWSRRTPRARAWVPALGALPRRRCMPLSLSLTHTRTRAHLPRICTPAHLPRICTPAHLPRICTPAQAPCWASCPSSPPCTAATSTWPWRASSLSAAAAAAAAAAAIAYADCAPPPPAQVPVRRVLVRPRAGHPAEHAAGQRAWHGRRHVPLCGHAGGQRCAGRHWRHGRRQHGACRCVACPGAVKRVTLALVRTHPPRLRRCAPSCLVRWRCPTLAVVWRLRCWECSSGAQRVPP